MNRVLRDAIAKYTAPVTGHKRARFFYATQISDRPFSVIVFVNDPRLVAKNYRKYLESYFRKAYEIRSAPVRILLQARPRGDAREESDADAERSRR